MNIQEIAPWECPVHGIVNPESIKFAKFRSIPNQGVGTLICTKCGAILSMGSVDLSDNIRGG